VPCQSIKAFGLTRGASCTFHDSVHHRLYYSTYTLCSGTFFSGRFVLEGLVEAAVALEKSQTWSQHHGREVSGPGVIISLGQQTKSQFGQVRGTCRDPVGKVPYPLGFGRSDTWRALYPICTRCKGPVRTNAHLVEPKKKTGPKQSICICRPRFSLLASSTTSPPPHGSLPERRGKSIATSWTGPLSTRLATRPRTPRRARIPRKHTGTRASLQRCASNETVRGSPSA
jgi:hypothetical protein